MGLETEAHRTLILSPVLVNAQSDVITRIPGGPARWLHLPRALLRWVPAILFYNSYGGGGKCVLCREKKREKKRILFIGIYLVSWWAPGKILCLEARSPH